MAVFFNAFFTIHFLQPTCTAFNLDQMCFVVFKNLENFLQPETDFEMQGLRGVFKIWGKVVCFGYFLEGERPFLVELNKNCQIVQTVWDLHDLHNLHDLHELYDLKSKKSTFYKQFCMLIVEFWIYNLQVKTHTCALWN